MSLINQVLNDLDKRGASTDIGEATIRVVPLRSRRSAVLLVAAGALGMLGVGIAAWLVWQAQQPPAAPPLRVAAAPVAPVLPASQPVAASAVQVVMPRIDGVSPNPVPAQGAAQIITIRGSNFDANASVTLRKEGGRAYTDRPVVSLAPDQIVLKSKFGRKPHSWTVEVVNADGHASGEYTFEVQAVAAPAPQVIGKPLADIAAAPPPNALPAGKGVNKHPTQLSKQQQAENEFRNGYQLMRQGRDSEALAGYEAALKLDPAHELARRTLVGLLLEKKRIAEAERALQDGLQVNPQQTGFAMLLARLQVEQNAIPSALDTLHKALPYADKQPDYQAFMAALLQRQNQHADAIAYYHKALQLKPQAGVWQMGLGISLHAEQRNSEARDAFQRALDSNSLNAELQAFVKQQLKEL